MTKMQAAAKGGRVVVDETSMLGHKDAVQLFKLAEKLDLKLIFVGDPMQHGSVPRGALMRMLKEYGGIKPFRLTEIMRQENPEYRAAAKLLSEGKTLEGFDALDGDGLDQGNGRRSRTVTGRSRPITCRRWTTRNRCWWSVPTHAEAAKITQAIRSELRDAGKLGTEERDFTRLVRWRCLGGRARAGDHLPAGRCDPVPPERQRRLHQRRAADRHRSGGGAAVGSRRNSRSTGRKQIALAEGDQIRFTGTVKTLDGEHKLKNGAASTRRRVHAKPETSGSITAGSSQAMPGISGTASWKPASAPRAGRSSG